MNLRVLIADHSAAFRRMIADALSSIPEVSVVGSASTGPLVVQKAKDLRPDLITLDIEMSGMDRLQVLDRLSAEKLETNILVISGLTVHGGQLTLEALQRGAFDFITKPATDDLEVMKKLVLEDLMPRIRALKQRLEVRKILRSGSSREMLPTTERMAVRQISSPSTSAPLSETVNSRIMTSKPEIVLIGVSTGGPNALQCLIPKLPSNLGVPVVIVQHMPPLFTQMLAENLTSISQLPVREAVNGEILCPGRIYIAPGGRQMRIAIGAERTKIAQITDDPPENNCRPAVDYLFRSVAQNFPGQAMAVILTGMGSDGANGLRLLKRHGCKVLVQDEQTCVVFGMPKAAIDAGMADAVLPISEIAARITSTVRGVYA